MQADKGKGKETKPAFQVTALEGTPRLSIKNPPQPSGSAYWSNSPAWVDAISGRPANPDHHRKHSDGSVDDFHFRHFDRVHDSSHHIGYGSEAQYLVVPGLTEDGRLVYQTVHCSRNRETYDPALYPDPNKPHPNWWDEQMSKSTQWFLKFRENGGMQPPAEDSEVPKVTDAEGNLITDEEAKQKVLSMWSSVIGPDLDNGIETKGHKHTPWGVFRPRASIITKTDVSSLLAHNFLHFGDGPKPPVTRITFNGDYSPDLDNVILRVKEMSEEARKRRTNAPTKGSSYLLIHSEYSKSWLPRTTSILAYPSQIDDLDKLSTKARILCDKTDQEATAHLEQTIKNATIAFTLFDKDPGHSKAIEERIIPYHNQGYQHGRLDPERRATALSKYISASVLQALNEQDRFSSTQSGSHITPCVSVPFSDYTWDEALKTGWIENKYLSAQSPGMVEAILADTERRLALHTGTGSREQGEAPPPSYDATMGYETRFALNTGDVGSSSATSGQPGDPRQNKYSAAGKNKPVSDENDDIIPGPVTAAAGEDSSSIDAAAHSGLATKTPVLAERDEEEETVNRINARLYRTPTQLPTQPLVQQVRKHPFVFFGLPFVGIIVGASFALQAFTQTRYDYHQTKVQTIEKESELGMKADRRKVDLREEYYRLNNPDALPSTYGSSSEPSLSSLDARPITKAPRKKFSMAAVSQDDYEPVRVPRPEGVPEWGAGKAVEEAPMKGYRKEDRWV